MEPTPEEALEKLARGAIRQSQETAWALFDQAWPAVEQRIWRFVRSLRLSEEFREDCGQNALLRVWRGREGYQGNSLDELGAWIYRITRNEAMRLVERAGRGPRRETGGRDGVNFDNIRGEHAEVDAQTLEREEAQALEHCIEALDERSQSLVELLYGDDAPSERAAASMLDLSKSHVNTLRQAALAALKQCLNGKGVQA